MIYNDKINQKPLTCFDFINIFPLISHSIKGAKNNAEGIVTVAIAIVVAYVEHPSISAIVVIAPRFTQGLDELTARFQNSPNPSQLYDNIIVSLYLFKCNTNEKSRSFFIFTALYLYFDLYMIYFMLLLSFCVF